MVSGYCMEVVFRWDATNLLENSVRPGTINSGEEEEGCIGHKLAAVDVEGSCAVVNLVSFVVIARHQILSHV